MSTTFTRKQLSLSFKLGRGSFGNSGYNTIGIDNARASAMVVKAGGASMGALQLRVWGMTLSQMNQLSTLGKLPMSIRNNVVVVSAGDEETGMGVVFEGTIADAWANLQAPPNGLFVVEAYAGLYDAVAPIPPTSYVGPTSVATIMAGLAAQMGLTFENGGVTAIFNNPYFPGTALSQVHACAEAANIDCVIDNGKLAIWPRGGSRGGQAPLVSPGTGMIGYPTFTAAGVVVRTIYNPNLDFGARVRVESELQRACGEWVIYDLSHSLESRMPEGEWHTEFSAYPPGYTPGV